MKSHVSSASYRQDRKPKSLKSVQFGSDPFFCDLRNPTHGANPWRRECVTLLFEMFYDILHDLAKLTIESDGIVTM
jgi:hypothetical protein